MEEVKHVIDVLLVDDSENDILMIQDVFEHMQMVNISSVVNDGEEALAYLNKEGEYANKKTPGLILLDINMPKLNGFEVLEIVKKNEKLKHIPVIMLTTSKREEDILNSYAKGACSFMTKPVRFTDLQKKIENFSMYWTSVSKIPEVAN